MFGNSTAALSHVHKLKCRKSNSHKASKHSNARLKAPAKLTDRGVVRVVDGGGWGERWEGLKRGGASTEKKRGNPWTLSKPKNPKTGAPLHVKLCSHFCGLRWSDPKNPESGHGLQNTDYRLRTNDYGGVHVHMGWECGRQWVCMCGFYAGQPLNLLSVYAASVLVRFSSEIYYILITPRGLVVAVKAYF